MTWLSIGYHTTARKILAYKVTGNFVDEYLRVSETTAMESLKLFAKVVVYISFRTILEVTNKP